jgi:hypothetical protein
MGLLEQALVEENRAAALDPLCPLFQVVCGLLQLSLGHIDQAIQQAAQAMEIDPKYGTAMAVMGKPVPRRVVPEKELPGWKKPARLYKLNIDNRTACL